MDPLNSLDGIAELIRKRAFGATAANLGKDKTGNISQTKQDVIQKKTAEKVKLKIVDAVSAISIQDPKRPQKMMSIFVENVLLWQLDEELINDANFVSFVDEVSAQLLNEPMLVDQLTNLIASSTGGAT
ncbi:hypothetical protein Meth11DRAFT_1149 [Methylophilaceae bacterium 11]|nr:hypothetical protein Meth11DRAFT_1149 [Methylophilaceae bacterium 11]